MERQTWDLQDLSEMVPEGRKLKSDATRKSISEYFRKGGESEQSRKRSLKNKLELMQTCIDNITQNEDWLKAGQDQQAGKVLLKDGIVQEAGHRECEGKPSCDVWNFWR